MLCSFTCVHTKRVHSPIIVITSYKYCGYVSIYNIHMCVCPISDIDRSDILRKQYIPLALLGLLYTPQNNSIGPQGKKA